MEPVPFNQGSILGPLLFILYINDISRTSNILDFILFADDTTITYSNKDIPGNVDLINNELMEVSNWFKANKLSVNASKTNYMILGTPHMTLNKAHIDLKIILNNLVLQRVQTMKFLGVLIDECLTWKPHIDCVLKTVSRNIGVINKLKHFIPNRILHTLYCSLVLPHLSYGILIWGNTCKMYLDKLTKIQKWAIRTITNSHYRAHTAPLFSKLNLLTVADLYTLELGVFMYRFSINDLLFVFKNYFTIRSEIHDYQTRFANNLNVTKNRKSFSDRSTRTSGPSLWNSLSTDIRESKTLKLFRKQLKVSLIQKYD